MPWFRGQLDNMIGTVKGGGKFGAHLEVCCCTMARVKSVRNCFWSQNDQDYFTNAKTLRAEQVEYHLLGIHISHEAQKRAYSRPAVPPCQRH
jgi:hypothetical protein